MKFSTHVLPFIYDTKAVPRWLFQSVVTVCLLFGIGYTFNVYADDIAIANKRELSPLLSAHATTDLVVDPQLVNPQIPNLMLEPLRLDYTPYIFPINLSEIYALPAPPGEALEPPAPSLNIEPDFRPWHPSQFASVLQVPDIYSLLQEHESVSPFDLLIIADETFVDELQPLKAHKDYTDIQTRIYSWQHLVKLFRNEGQDDPERIKKAIASFQDCCGIKYAMLVGDSDRFPVRYCKIYDPTHWGDGYAPADLYYADLYTQSQTFDNWDGDGDGIFCEMQGGTWIPGLSLADINLDNLDLYPDIAVGRVPASTEAEVTTYVNKIINYEFSAYKAAWFHDKALLIVPGYEDDKNEYYDYPGSWGISEKIAHHLNDVDMQSIKLYDHRIESLTSGLSDDDPTLTNISNAINSGVGFVSFSGHGNRTIWGGALGITDVSDLNNTEKLPIIFAAACNTAQFHTHDSFLDTQGNTFIGSEKCPNRCWPVDPEAAQVPEPAAIQRNSQHNFDVDSMAEEFLVKQDSGGIGYIGAYTGTQGGSQLLANYFFRAYRDSYKPASLGFLWNYAVRRYIDNNFHIDFNTKSNWVPQALFHHIQKYVLFGDPSLRVGGISRIQRADFAATYAMKHDGWQGTLKLELSHGDSIEQTPNLRGIYTSSEGNEQKVRAYVRTATYPQSSDWGPDHKIGFYIDFADTATRSDDQFFEGYLFTQTREAIAGIAYWNDIPFGFFATKEGTFAGGPNFVSGPVSIPHFLGKYRMNHDGWKGTLELRQSNSGEIVGTYTSDNGTSHNVRSILRTTTNPLPNEWGPDHKIELYIDFSDTANLNDDQKFEAYLFTQTKDAMAGITWWNNRAFGFYAEKYTPNTCEATISPDFTIHIPALYYQTVLGNMTLSADFEFLALPNGKESWKVSGYEEISTTCDEPATLSDDLALHIPTAVYTDTQNRKTHLWGDFRFVPDFNGHLVWELVDFGIQ